MTREFFQGHRHHVVFLGFVENGTSLVSIDSRGFLYQWDYDKKDLLPALQFRPSFKMRVAPDFTKYNLMSSQRLFPDEKSRDITTNPDKLSKAVAASVDAKMKTIDPKAIRDKAIDVYYNERDRTTVINSRVYFLALHGA